MKSSTPEKTAQLSGLAQTGGYVFAAFGPILFGYSKSLFHSWTPAILMLLVLTIIMAIALYQVEKSRSYFITIVWLEDSSSGLFVHTKKELGTCPSSKFYYPLNEICTWSLWFAVSPPRSGIWFHVLAGP